MANEAISNYIKEINKAYERGDATEHTHRPALKALIESLGKKITATNEPKRIACGAPDYVISRKVKNIDQAIGYIEAKDIGENLGKILKTEQVKKRYLPSLHNFILTDYIEFRWYVGNEHRMTVRLADETGGKFKLSGKGEEEFLAFIEQFFDQEPVRIKNAKELAAKMAGKAKFLRDIIQETFKHESEKGALHGQYEAFKKVLLHDLKEEQFADIYAQTICYGLFAARCYINDAAVWGKDKHAAFHGVDGKEKGLTRENAAYLLPKTNPFLRNIFSDIAGPRLDDRIAWLVDDLIVLLRETNMGDVLKGFGRKTKRQDPVIHFYETFLAEYDAKLKKSRGVYYTPEPVVSYIVRSVDWILKEKFGLKKGLADNSKIKAKVGKTEKEFHKCLVLDPAAGTGTFLYEVIKQIQKNMSRQKGAWSGYVKKHLLPRLFGFEIMMAPYAVCHMKLGLELADSGYDFEDDERLGVYLTNTLEEAEDISGFFGFARDLAEEAEAANEIKRDMPIMVVLGNPPYSGHSSNRSDITTFIEPGQKYTIQRKDGRFVKKTAGKNGVKLKQKTFIGKLIQDYYQVDGEPLGEKNSKWLQDDYVKFIRYGQHRIQETGSGVLAFITNHGYLDNPTFRGMRQQLMETFTDIYILDLHGNSKRKERCPDGSPDKNVFDIQQGVSIGIFVKEPEKKRPSKVHHHEIWGERKNKYEWLNNSDVNLTDWVDIEPQPPFYLLKKQNTDSYMMGENDKSITDIFPLNGWGIATRKDYLLVHFDRDIIIKRFRDIRNLNPEKAIEKYQIKESRHWDFNKAHSQMLPDTESQTKPILFRPFDIRTIYYQKCMIERGDHRYDLMRHMFSDNLSLISVRRIETFVTQGHFFCTNNISVLHSTSSKEGNFAFPLYLYPEKGELFTDTGGHWESGEGGRVPNLDKGFVDEFAGRLGLKFVSDGKGDLRKTFGPEDIFSYIYAVFHSPGYRKRYAEFLRIDFPRVPLTGNKKMFAELCKVGEELVGLHLMESNRLEDDSRYPAFDNEGASEVEKGYPKYVVTSDEPDKGKVHINDKQYFEGVKQEVWEFCVGGYQVCEKWLKDRRGRKLSFNDVEHYQKITVALGDTIKAMSAVDEIIDGHGGWPIK